MIPSGRETMSWLNAVVRGLIIFLYFFFATVWLPDLVVGLIAGASELIQGLVAVGIWGLALVAGMWLLRQAQERGTI